MMPVYSNIPIRVGSTVYQATNAFLRNRTSNDLDALRASFDTDPRLREEFAAQENAVPPGYRYDLSYNTTRGLFAFKEDTSRLLFFQFNPTTITDSKDVQYEERQITGFDSAKVIWISGGSRPLNFQLFLDATEASRKNYLGKSGGPVLTSDEIFTHDPSRGVLNQVEFLQSLQRPYFPDANSPRFIRGGAINSPQFTPPPEVIFVYGNFYLEGVITSLSIEYSAFNRDLIPLRATADITFRVTEGQEVRINEDVTKFANQGFSVNANRVI